MFLTEKQIRDTTLYREMLKRELDAMIGEHGLLGKYMEKRWFQKTMHRTYAQLYERYIHLAQRIECIEQEMLNQYKKLRDHLDKMEEVYNSLKPFEYIDLKTATLTQQELF